MIEHWLARNLCILMRILILFYFFYIFFIYFFDFIKWNCLITILSRMQISIWGNIGLYSLWRIWLVIYAFPSLIIFRSLSYNNWNISKNKVLLLIRIQNCHPWKIRNIKRIHPLRPQTWWIHLKLKMQIGTQNIS